MMTAPTFEEMASRSELEESLRKAPERLLLGEPSEAPSLFLRFVPKNNERVAIGIVSGTTGIKPQVFEYSGGCFFGFDQQVVRVSLEPLEKKNTINLDGVFYEIIKCPESPLILIVHELGVVSVDLNLTRQWSVDTDVLNSWRVDGNTLILQEQDSDVIRKINLGKGSHIQ